MGLASWAAEKAASIALPESGLIFSLVNGLKVAARAVMAFVRQYPWQALCIALALAVAWEGRERRVAEAALPAWKNAFAGEQMAFQDEKALAGNLAAQVADQNASIDALHRISNARTKAAQSALAGATARGNVINALAGQISTNAPHGHSMGDCRTPAIVMNAKGYM